jgi:hypothetical protein
MADVLISNLPTYTASTVTGTYFIINNSGNTTTFKATREQFIPVSFGTGCCSIIGNGGNTVSGSYSVAFGGSGNLVTQGCAAIVGGINNTACAVNSFIGGGLTNKTSGTNSAVLGGQSNTASGKYSAVLGGYGNTASGCYSAVLGGNGNTVSGSYSAVFGNSINASQPNTLYVNNLCAVSNINAGTVCPSSLYISTFLSGCAVCIGAGGLFQTYTSGGGGGGGPMSTGCGTCSIIGNCSINGAGLVCDYSFVGGGCFNSGYGTFSFLGGGQCNSLNSCNTVIAGGRSNCINYQQPYSTIGGGQCNIITSSFPTPGITIAGGIGHGTTGGTFDAYTCFCWSSNPSATCTGSFSFIGGGFQNNSICNYGVTVGGQNNTNCSSGGFMGSGGCNLLNGYCSVLVGGVYNSITCGGFANMMVGGYFNKLIYGGYSFVGGGQCNTIGCCNSNACFNNVVGGTKAYVDGQFGFIGNSADCCVFSPCANIIGCQTYGSTILNGASNCIAGSFSPGCLNFYSTILGGYGNTTSCCFQVVYGCCNYAMGNFTNIFGCGIMGSSSCTTYFNNVCVCGTLSKMSGSFKIPHPDPSKTNKFLQHSFVEAPTAGENIYRYTISTTNCSASIELPDYYKFLNENDQVFVTPKNHFGNAYGIVNQEQTCVSFCSNCDGDYNVLIIGTRKDMAAKKYWKGTEVNESQD